TKVSITYSVTVSDPIVSATLQGVFEINREVTTSISTSVSNSAPIAIPPFGEGFGNYGVKMQIATGHLFGINSSKKDYGSVISYTPIATGWCTWTETAQEIINRSGVDPCHEVPSTVPIHY